MKRLLMSCVAVVVLAGAAVAGAAAAGADEAPASGCWKTSVTVPESADDTSRWTYVHTVDWCGNGNTVTRINIQGEFTDQRAADCEQKGDPEINRDRDPSTPELETFSMGTLICAPPNVEPQQVCPWVIVAVTPDGQSHHPTTGVERTTLSPRPV
ncbi:hypothetical protein [Actinophytocola sediminis]